ncbi:Epidermal cell differentiation inhibitor [Staphylococcus schweitzeri]|uniref:Epidermal cell differentiation inhibitor n=1 Tax=Staphylococcus schweitzeri TaxID=1654388 RepID=A0A2K4AJN5_9STAP|nr:epidermal cell differentiation inhibitor EdnB [Staphylococcus schweitzeri]MBE2129670.1 epidermal cell differentiation inhibitor B EdnB [Staphylococcus schweitzeri]PNZ50273.1 Epidermal cell differentiation inhibitor [Staphylococcus schweitzeri]
MSLKMKNTIIKFLSTFIVLSSISLIDTSFSSKYNKISIAAEAKNFTDLVEATKWGNSLIKSAKYSSKDKMAIYNYTKNSSPINTPLRSANGDVNKLPENIQEQIRQLDSTISKSVTPDSVYVYRLLNLDYLSSITGFTREDLHMLQQTNNGQYDEALVSKLNNLMNSRIYRENGYSSTQLVSGAAVAGRPIELKLELPKGTKAAYIDSKELTAYPGQQEVLLPRGTEYAVGSVKLSDNKKKIIITAVVFKK